MLLRKYRSDDVAALAGLFYETVHCVNQKDYTKEQLDAWATGKIDLKEWDRSFLQRLCIVAVVDEIIVGFGDLDQMGYLDRLYVHKDYQRKGIATAICNELERAFFGKITVHASVTARPFFEKRGYQVVREQQVERQGIFLKNFLMEKILNEITAEM